MRNAPPTKRPEPSHAKHDDASSREALVELAGALEHPNFELREPKLHAIVEWTARGFTAYDASYVALAQSEAMRSITDDRLILAVAPEIALAL